MKFSIVFILFFFSFSIARSQVLSYNKDSLRGFLFSLNRFNENLEVSLKDSAVGWAYAIWKDGKKKFGKAGGFGIVADDTKNGKGEDFTEDTRIHIASLSKTITALAVAKLVEMGKIKWDNRIKEFLPSAWKLHVSFENVTIRDLLTMTSGLDAPLDAASSGFDSLKAIMERGPNPDKIGKFNYQNTSYGLFRIIIAYVNGSQEFAEGVQSEVTSVTTANRYMDFVNKMVLQPAGINQAECRISVSDTRPAFRYSFPYDGLPGELTGNSITVTGGNLTEFSGGFGWYLSVGDLGKLLNAVFYKKKILRADILQQLVDMDFPLGIRNRNFGNYFGAGGDWGHPIKPKGWAGIHTFFYCFPDNVRVIVFTNSGERSPSGKMLRAYRNAFEKITR